MDPTRLVAAGYDRIHERYDEWSTRVDDPVRRRYVERAGSLVPEGSGLLDLGCGTGLRTAHLAQRFQTVGVDISSESLAVAKANNPTSAFVQADMAAVGFRPRSFDLVTAFYSLIHVPRAAHARVLRSISGWLRPGGHAVITMGGGEEGSEGTEDDWLGTQMFWSGWDHRTNRRLVETAGFDLVSGELVTQEEDGKPVTFLWVVARIR